GNGVGNPVVVARDAITHATTALYDVVIVDTAGRLGIDDELMQQASDIRDAVQPQEILFVLDAMTGQDAVVTAQSFLDGVGFTGVVLTKLDGDARGGAALSVRELTGRPVMFASTGEKLEDFEIFHPDRMASRILGMGDLLTLIEQAERAFDDDQKSRLADKVATGEDFTLDDFLEQMQAVQKMGSLSKVMSMLPGLGDMREAIDNLDDSDIKRIAAIIESMTPAERKDPSVLNASRRARIAAGSGRTVTDVNQLVDRFTQARKMMKQMAKTGGLGMGGPGMPIPGMGGHGGKKAKPKPAKSKKGRSGNPAKRAAQDAGLDLTEGESSAANFELPSAFKDLLGGK
ncbi:MAG: signal recognition particle protein, partial [Actinobacteria bacterium]|nr:signal recognition particle protein [Actinomycetota bacterium]